MRTGLLLLLTLLAALARADNWGGMAGVVSDYAYRGLTLSNQQPAVRADVHYAAASNWFGGLDMASVRRDPEGSDAAEVSPYLGHAWALDQDWNARLTLSHYAYIDHGSDRYDYDELEARLGFRQRVALSLAASPDTSVDQVGPAGLYAGSPVFSRRSRAYAWELAVDQPLVQGLSAEAGLGYRDLQAVVGVDYVYWSAGVDYARGPITLDLLRIGTSAAARELCCGQEPVNRWVVGAFWHF